MPKGYLGCENDRRGWRVRIRFRFGAENALAVIAGLATREPGLRFRCKETYFGNLYQKVVVTRPEVT